MATFTTMTTLHDVEVQIDLDSWEVVEEFDACDLLQQMDRHEILAYVNDELDGLHNYTTDELRAALVAAGETCDRVIPMTPGQLQTLRNLQNLTDALAAVCGLTDELRTVSELLQYLAGYVNLIP